MASIIRLLSIITIIILGTRDQFSRVIQARDKQGGLLISSFIFLLYIIDDLFCSQFLFYYSLLIVFRSMISLEPMMVISLIMN